MPELLYKKEVYNIIGAAMEVHKELGCGFLEAVYQEAFALELEERGIPFVQEKSLEIYYKDFLLDKKYRVDFICYDKIIVEIKALTTLLSEHESQLLNYLKAAEMRLGLLINYGTKSLQHKRMIL